jgi:membrane glycosyltransferase
MSKFFDFYDPLEKRYVFNSFLVVVGLVEVLILVFTLIWQIDEGIFAEQVEQVRVVPFPWKEYLLTSFAAPIALLFLFGLIVQGFELLGREAPGSPQDSRQRTWGRLRRRAGYFLGLAGLLAALLLFFWGEPLFALLTAGVKALGLGGAYLLIALLALALLYLPLRLLVRYRLQKKAMEYQYLLTLAARHGVKVVDPRLQSPPLAPPGEKKTTPP